MFFLHLLTFIDCVVYHDYPFKEVQDLSDGCGTKFMVNVVSTKFEGMPLIKRHR